jgi:hypothetical protein
MHLFLEKFYSLNADPNVPVEATIDEINKLVESTTLALVEPDKQRSALHLDMLMRQYIDHYGEDPHKFFRPIMHDGKEGIELEVDFYLTPRIKWRQHFDGLVEIVQTHKTPSGIELSKGEIVILEHKTSSGDMRKSLKERMLPNDQAEGYVYGANRILGLPVNKVLFNGLGTYRKLVEPGYRQNYANKYGKECQPLFYQHVVEITDEFLNRWENDSIRDANRLIEDIEDSNFSRNAPDACTLWGRKCVYSSLCEASCADRKDLIEWDFEKESWKGWNIEYDK